MKKCILCYVSILIFLPQLFSLQGQNIQAEEYFLERGLDLPGHSIQQVNFSQVSDAQLNSFISDDDGNFSDQFIRAGLDGVVEDVAVFGGEIIIGGRFRYYNGGENLNNIARWNGEHFEPIGASFFRSVDALLVQNGSLIAAGRLINQEGRATTVARWDGSSWQSLGNAFDDGILDLADYGGEIIAAGGFLNNGDTSVNNIAKWNGSDWEALDSGIQFDSGSSVIWALEVHDDYLIAGGEFSQAGSNSANSVARWDGTSWQPLAEGFSRIGSNFNLVSSLTTYEGNLILSGFYLDPLSEQGRHTDIMMWTGTGWIQLGDRFDGKLVQSMTDYKNRLVTAGSNLGPDQNFDQYLSFYENSSWTKKQNILQELESVRDINSIFADGERLIMGGSFHTFESGIYNVAFFEDELLSPKTDPSLNFAPLGAVHSMMSYEGDIILGGDFKYAGSEVVNNVVRFTGTEWERMGDGFEEEINVITQFNGDLIAAGNYSQSNLNINIARWNGSEWEPLGDGLSGNINALIEFEGKLIAAGTSFFSNFRNHFAVWDGEEWSLLIEDPGDFLWTPRALAIYNDELIVGGRLMIDESSGAQNVGRWNGDTFSPVGGGLNDSVLDLIVYNGDLVAGGIFTHSGDTSVPNIARWDGESWAPIGNGFDSGVGSLEIHEDELYASGNFSRSGNTITNGLARWNGSEWQSLGSGINSPARLYSDGDLLHIGGSFSEAGNLPAANYTTWSRLSTSISDETNTRPTGFELKQNFPNPFNPMTVISYQIPVSGDVSLKVYDMLGREVATLVDSRQSAGTYQVEFDASRLASGVYLYRLITGEFVQTRQMVLVK